MKKTLVIFGLLSLMAVNVFAQENVFKLNPLSLFLATGNVSYERAIGEKSALQLGFYYSGVKISDAKYAGWGVTPEYRIYLGQEVMNSFYAAPFIRYQNFSISDKTTDSKASMTLMGGGVVLGRQWLIGESFVIDLFFGPAYNSADFKVTAGEDTFADGTKWFDGFGLRSGIKIGFAF